MVSKSNPNIGADTPAVAAPPVNATLSARAALLLALILPVFALAPLLYPGYFQTHAGFTPLWNLADLRANLGQLTWLPHLATRFDPLRSAGLLPYYLAALLPLAPIAAVKFVIGVGWLLGSLGLFLWLRSWLGSAGALVSALVYTYLPHQIVTVYVRGAWGESLFWGLLPWGALATTYLVTSPKLKLTPMATLFWLALGLTQLGLTLWALLLVLLLLLVVHRPQALLPAGAALGGTALAMAVYLILPARPLFPVSLTQFTDHFLYPFQLLSAYWGFGPSRPGWNDGLSLQLGLAAVGLSLLALFVWQRGESPAPRTDRRLLFFGAAALALILLQFGLTSALWQLPLLAGYPLSATLTYPWQLLGLIGLCLAALAGAALWLEPRLAQLPLLGAVVIIIILAVYPYLLPRFMQPRAGWLEAPQAILGDSQLAALNYEFWVATTDYTVDLQRGPTEIPLAARGPLQANDTLRLRVTWQPLSTFGENWKVFAHLVDSHGKVLAQFDGQPQAGAYPTSRWIPGELINDTYAIQLPAGAPPGPYRVLLGLYDEATFARLPVAGDAEGRVILDVQ